MLKGVYSVLPTPFTPDDRIDRDSLRRVIDLFLAAGVDGLTALGVTSETARLTGSERRVVLETVLERAGGKIPVVVGATAEGTAAGVELALSAREAGASALLVSPPRMPKLSSEAVVRHFATLAAAVDLPIVIQDYPPISGYSMEPALLSRIAHEVPSARCIKLEDPPTPFKIARIREQTEGIKVAILGGLGGVYLLEELLSGAAGAMTGFAYPEILVRIVRSFEAGRIEKAAEDFYRHVPLMRFEFQEGIGMAIRKEILHRRGAVAHPGVRPPGLGVDAATREALDRLLVWAGLP
jgi:4-hydroxy-tetrahydrodipicolinate synthase